jgi:hypothetical protein
MDTMTKGKKIKFLENTSNTKTVYVWRMSENYIVLYYDKSSNKTRFNAWQSSLIHPFNRLVQQTIKIIKTDTVNFVSQIRCRLATKELNKQTVKLPKYDTELKVTVILITKRLPFFFQG